MITAMIVFLALPETKPKTQAGEKEKTMMQTIGGYGQVFRDKLFITLLILAIISTIVYVQMNTTLSVFLRDIHNIPPQGYGYILSLNAVMIVLFQFLVTQKIKSHPPLILIATGTLLYAIGFGMYGFVSTFTLFLFAMVIITIGEMIIAPIGQSIIADLAPEHMRGRYMAAFGINWGLSYAFGPLMAGIIIDKFNPNWIWYIGGILCGLSAIGYILLQLRAGERFKPLSIVTSPDS